MGELIPPIAAITSATGWSAQTNVMESIYARPLCFSHPAQKMYCEYAEDIKEVLNTHNVLDGYGVHCSPYTIMPVNEFPCITAQPELRNALLKQIEAHTRFFAYCKALAKLFRESRRVCLHTKNQLNLDGPLCYGAEAKACVYLFNQDPSLYRISLVSLLSSAGHTVTYDQLVQAVERQPKLVNQRKFKKALDLLHEEHYIYNLTR